MKPNWSVRIGRPNFVPDAEFVWTMIEAKRISDRTKASLFNRRVHLVPQAVVYH